MDAIRQLADMQAVYRMFDGSGCLLYIGKTGRAGERFGDHGVKRWFPLVAAITLEWHGDAAAAADAESRAILSERPRYNLRGVEPPKRKPWRPVPKIELPPAQVAIPDVLSVFGDARRLHWQTIAARLNGRFPNRWEHATAVHVSRRMRELGVSSKNVRQRGAGVLKGCERTAVEAALAALLP